MKSVFSWIDEHSDSGVIGYFTGILRRPVYWRRRFIPLVLLSLLFWVVLGFDSTWEMVDPILTGWIIRDPLCVWKAVTDVGGSEWIKVTGDMYQWYGMGNHWSAPVIYGLAWIYLSYSLERSGICGSLNFFATSAMSLGNIGVFEYAYNFLYSRLQGQGWTFSLVEGNRMNMGFFTVFIFIGFYFFLLLMAMGYKINLSEKLKLCTALSLLLWVLWVFYPFPVTHATLQTDSGLWVSGDLFPQTYYAVKASSVPGEKGIPVYMGNDLLHLVNVLCKTFSAASLALVSSVKRDGVKKC